MADWRATQKAVCTDPRHAMLSEYGQILAMRLPLHADDYGAFQADPLRLKLLCTPASQRPVVDVEAALAEMASVGLIGLYRTADGVLWGVVINWDEDQPRELIRKRGARRSPEPMAFLDVANTDGIFRKFPEVSGKGPLRPRQDSDLDQDHPTDVRAGRLSSQVDAAASGFPGQPELPGAPAAPPNPPSGQGRKRSEVFDAWVLAFRKGPQAKMAPGDKRDRAIKARLAEGATIDDLIRCVQGYAKDPWRHESPTHCELATLLRDRGRVEAGMELAVSGPPKRNGGGLTSRQQGFGQNGAPSNPDGSFNPNHAYNPVPPKVYVSPTADWTQEDHDDYAKNMNF